MATTSLAMPPQPGGDDSDTVPAMLDRVRGLAATANRQTNHHHHHHHHHQHLYHSQATQTQHQTNGGGFSGVMGGGLGAGGGGAAGTGTGTGTGTGGRSGGGGGGGSSVTTTTGSSARLDGTTALSSINSTTPNANGGGNNAAAAGHSGNSAAAVHAFAADSNTSPIGNPAAAPSASGTPSTTNITTRPAANSISSTSSSSSSSLSSSAAASPSTSRPPHRLTQAGRISKSSASARPRPTPTPSAASSSSASSLATQASLASTASSTTSTATCTSPPLPAHPNFSSRQNRPRHTRGSSSYSSSPLTGAMPSATATATATAKPASTGPSRTSSSTATTMPDIDPPVLSFWGPDPVPLPSRFARIKRNLIKGHEAELEASWKRIIRALRAEVEHIEGLGAHLIPSIEFADIEDHAQTTRFGRDLRRYGVGVVRKVMPKSDADNLVHKTVTYLEDRHGIKPLEQDPTCYDFFWTPAQVLSRADPSVLRAQRYMMSLWETNPEDRLASKLPITYVDRIRIHGATDQATQGLQSAPTAPPQSADDWITQLQSSAGIIAQVDNGSLERWEPDGYQRGGTYDKVFHGQWEDYDPWECTSRVSSTTDLYNGYAACTIFRMFQGVLALSTIEPGMIRLLPSPKLATAYYLLRPFFSPKTPMPETRQGPAWDSYLAPDNWKLERDPDTIIHGAVPGHAQRITENWHPHLYLRSSMITLPTLQPGDYIFWHPDLPYHISSNNPGLKTPSSIDDITMLVYIPAAPLTQTNALYLARQRRAFQRGHPGPDFDSSVRSLVVEDQEYRVNEKDIAEVGGVAGLQAMGLAPWETASTRAGTPPSDKAKTTLLKDGGAKGEQQQDANSDEMETENEIKSQSSSSSSSHAEAEVVRLSNIILFPDRSMMGYSV